MRRIAVRTAAVVALVAVTAWLTRGNAPALTDDFIAYWSAARLLASGGNPYDVNALLSAQQSAGWPYANPLPTWYGPWILAVAAPIGFLPYWPARVGWLVAQIASLLVAAIVLGRVYRFDPRSRTPTLIAVSFAATILCLAEGQVTPFALLGLAGFVWFERSGRDWLAGAALFPVTAKPLTLYLFFIVLGLWVLRARRLRVAGGLAAAVAAGSLIALTLRPTVFAEWLQFSRTVSPLVQAYTPTIGTLLRAVFGVNRTWLAYLAAIAGIAFLIARWRDYGATLAWSDTLPSVSLVSLLTTPFAWSHDALLLLPALLQGVRRRATDRDRYAWIALNVIAVGLYPWLRYRQAIYILYPAAILVWRVQQRSRGVPDLGDEIASRDGPGHRR